MIELRFTNAAREDLKHILIYSIRTWGMAQAQRYSGKLQTHIQRIAEDDVFHKPVPNGRPNLRQSTVGRHLVIFEANADHTLIVRVLHEAMDVTRHIG
jgi:toxin ParE1/3/4